jgi:putative DNA primase/helicase
MGIPFNERLAGRWGDILPELGISSKFLTGKNCPCPRCGGKDRFRFVASKGLFICTHCGAGDGIKLLMMVNGWDFKETADRIKPLIGAAKVVKTTPQSDWDKRQALRDLWIQSKPITRESAAGRFLTKRTGITEYPSCLRAVDRLRYWDGGLARWFPAMIALVTGGNDKPVNLHRTWLTDSGGKAPVESARKMMAGGVPKGSAVRLATPTDTLGVGEGIETCIAASLIHGVPVWAVLGTSGMLGWEPPIEVARVIVFGDCDEGYGGQAAAYALAYRLTALPKRKIDVEVRIPGYNTIKRDWNDVLKQNAGVDFGATPADDTRTETN